MAEASEQTRRIRLMTACRALVHAIQHEDEAVLERLLSVGRSRRMFAPIAFAIGALALLLEGLKVLIGNWRLMLIQILPALLIWIAMLDLRLHALHGRSFHVVRGAILIPIRSASWSA